MNGPKNRDLSKVSDVTFTYEHLHKVEFVIKSGPGFGNGSCI